MKKSIHFKVIDSPSSPIVASFPNGAPSKATLEQPKHFPFHVEKSEQGTHVSATESNFQFSSSDENTTPSEHYAIAVYNREKNEVQIVSCGSHIFPLRKSALRTNNGPLPANSNDYSSLVDAFGSKKTKKMMSEIVLKKTLEKTSEDIEMAAALIGTKTETGELEQHQDSFAFELPHFANDELEPLKAYSIKKSFQRFEWESMPLNPAKNSITGEGDGLLEPDPYTTKVIEYLQLKYKKEKEDFTMERYASYLSFVYFLVHFTFSSQDENDFPNPLFKKFKQLFTTNVNGRGKMTPMQEAMKIRFTLAAALQIGDGVILYYTLLASVLKISIPKIEIYLKLMKFEKQKQDEDEDDTKKRKRENGDGESVIWRLMTPLKLQGKRLFGKKSKH